MLESFPTHAAPPLFRRVSVDLGVHTIEIPVAEIEGDRSGKTLLVTAGMDGDEYAGMCAAFRLVETFQNKAFSGRLIIVPLVNQPGYEAGLSENPIDHKFPKQIFPGRALGKASERLIHWLATTYVSEADAWHDMHGGAHDEHLRPFLWVSKTRNTAVDELTKNLLRTTSAQTVLQKRAGFFSKERQLAKRGCWFVLAESGELGEQNAEDIERHVRWVKETMSVLGMLDALPKNSDRRAHIFSRVKQKTRLRHGDESRLLWWKNGGPYFVSL